VVRALKRQIQEALANGDELGAERLLDDLVEYRQRLEFADRGPDAVRRSLSEGFDHTPQDDLHAIRAWSHEALAGRLREPVAETRRLNLVLRSWFDSVELAQDQGTLTIKAHPRPANDKESAAQPTITATSDVGAWYVAQRVAWQAARTCTNAEHGRPPRHRDWPFTAADHPASTTVTKRYGPWSNALSAAGL
jgi:hypothetical protein